jgi:RNA polymerase sigma-70 factor, ECF subfamily
VCVAGFNHRCYGFFKVTVSCELLIGNIEREMTESEFRRVFHENKDAIYNFALRLTGSGAIAEDLSQDCFLELLRNPAKYNSSRGPVRSFLLGITRNLAHRRWRDERQTEPLDAEMKGFVPNLIAGEVSTMVAAAIQSLPPLQREVVLLFEYEGFTLDEIADLVEVEVGAVKSRLHRARERLRYTLAPLRNATSKT